jgi:hypothetical protein
MHDVLVFNGSVANSGSRDNLLNYKGAVMSISEVRFAGCRSYLFDTVLLICQAASRAGRSSQSDHVTVQLDIHTSWC